jgi:hypothetical protein
MSGERERNCSACNGEQPQLLNFQPSLRTGSGLIWILPAPGLFPGSHSIPAINIRFHIGLLPGKDLTRLITCVINMARTAK